MTPNPDSPTGTAPEAVKAFKPSTLVAGIPLVPLPADFQGKWVVLDDDQETIRAVADTFPEILGLAQQLGLVDSVIERAPWTSSHRGTQAVRTPAWRVGKRP